MAKRSREEDDSSDDSRSAAGYALSSRANSVEPAAHPPKYASLDCKERLTMQCLLPPHKPMGFATYAEYETHYQQAHTNRCSDCRKNLPSAHFLDLHIAENHDPIVATKRDAGEKSLACFVEGCEKMCFDWKKRRNHLIDKHGFPKNYDFLIIDSGIDGKRSILRPGVDAQGHRKSSRERDTAASLGKTTVRCAESTSDSKQDSTLARNEATSSDTSTSDTGVAEAVASNIDTSIDGLTSSMSSLRMVPRSITFGKRKGRSGFANR